MQINLSQKERMLLEDQKNQEDICVIKYQNYSNQAQDPELKQLFTTLSGEERHHYDMINQMLQGQQPTMSGSNQNAQQSTQQQSGQQSSSYQGAMSNTGDKTLCSDLLSTEKFVSSTYGTGVFEAADPTVRQTLQHIQQDEQRHGEQIFNYMSSHGMYNVK